MTGTPSHTLEKQDGERSTPNVAKKGQEGGQSNAEAAPTGTPHAVLTPRSRTPASLPALTSRPIVPRHGPGQAADIVLQEPILVLQLLVLEPDGVDAVGQRRQARLQAQRVPVHDPEANAHVSARGAGKLFSIAQQQQLILGGGGGVKWSGVRGELTYACNDRRVSWLSRSTSSLFRRGLMARASSGPNCSSSSSTSACSWPTVFVPLDGRELGFGRASVLRPSRSGSLSEEEAVEEACESGCGGGEVRVWLGGAVEGVVCGSGVEAMVG